jgi:L-arabinokinase
VPATPPPTTNPPPDLLRLEPVPTLLRRVRAELSADFPPRSPMRISRAPGRLDVMGGIADYTGSLVCEATLDRAAAVALRERDDRELQVFSFNLYDEHRPFTFRMPLDRLATASIDDLRREFAAPGRKWAGYLAGCLFVLHEAGLIDLRAPKHKGLNLALYSTVPLGAGVSSSAAIEVATMMNLVDHFGIRRDDATRLRSSQTSDSSTAVVGPESPASSRKNSIDPMRLAALCQSVENRVVGAPCGIMDQVSSCYGNSGSLLRMVCQPHELQPPLTLPPGIRAVGINSNVKHSVGGGMYGRTRCAAFMAHRIILQHMRALGQRAGRTLERDPTNGYLANLDPDDYKNLFRPHLPEAMRGEAFLKTYGGTIDEATTVEPNLDYHVRSAADHHVLEARRVKRFVDELELATREGAENPGKRSPALDRAGHLMYGSHFSYTHDARLGADECDSLVQLVRDREGKGLYGAKITGGGSGGTVAVLCEKTPEADAAIGEIMDVYASQTGKKPEAFLADSPGAWHVGTVIV